MHCLTLPSLLLKGNGDAIDGCMQAVAEAAAAAVRGATGSGSQGGGSGQGGAGTLVLHLPRIEVQTFGYPPARSVISPCACATYVCVNLTMPLL